MIRGEATLGFWDLWRILAGGWWLSYMHIGLLALVLVAIASVLMRSHGRPVALDIIVLMAAFLAVLAMHILKVWLVLRTPPEVRHLSFEIDDTGLRLRRDGKEDVLPWSGHEGT